MTMIRFALLAMLVVGCATAPVVTPPPAAPAPGIAVLAVASVPPAGITYKGHGEHLLMVDYPAGEYLLTWTATGVWPDGRLEGCRLRVEVDGPDLKRTTLLSVPVGPGASADGAARASIGNPADGLGIDGTGCMWTVTIAPA